jgi:hypothetical protein
MAKQRNFLKPRKVITIPSNEKEVIQMVNTLRFLGKPTSNIRIILS